MILPSTTFRQMLDDIVSIERSNVMTISLTLRNYKEPDFIIEDLVVEAVSLNQDFSSNTTDRLQTIVTLRPKQIIELNKRQSDLYATLTIDYIDPDTGELILDEDPEVYEFKVFVHNLENLAQKYGIGAFESIDDPLAESEDSSESQNLMLTIDLDLIGATEYTVNRSSFHGILTDVTVEEAVKFCAINLGITKINMMPADNTTKYRHLIIPPEYGDFGKIFEYIQFHYGIYTNGIRSYITEGVLYVYPPFDMESEREPKLVIHKAAPQSFLGSANYHDLDDNELKIVSSTDAIQQNLSNTATENDGNSHLILKSDELIDGQVDHLTMKSREMTVAITTKLDNSIASRSVVARYHQPTMNVFSHASKLAEGATEILGLGWQYARPYSIQPGMPVLFLFDEKEIVMVKHGVVESVDYNFERSGTKNNRYAYNCTATILLRMENDVKIFEL